MREENIVTRLKAQVPAPAPTPPPLDPPPPQGVEQSAVVPDAANELMLLKLSNELGIEHPDPKTTQRLQFIYETAAASAEDQSYEAILASVNDYLLRLGFKFREDRFMRLYLWMKLNRERVAIEQEMENARR